MKEITEHFSRKDWEIQPQTYWLEVFMIVLGKRNF
jgi:hypothetical protein